MNDVHLLVIPFVTSLALVPMRRQRRLYWWLSLTIAGCLIVLAIMMIGHRGPANEMLGAVLFYLLPLVLMFLVLRADLFARRPYLIPLVGPVVYLLGVVLSLSVGVTLGILQP